LLVISPTEWFVIRFPPPPRKSYPSDLTDEQWSLVESLLPPEAEGLCGPHWFVALVLPLLPVALKPNPRLKFSLADLLVLMTFSAVLIAGVAG
jgi:hypothetical protein